MFSSLGLQSYEERLAALLLLGELQALAEDRANTFVLARPPSARGRPLVVGTSKDVEIGAVRVNASHSNFVVQVVDKPLRCSDSLEECVRRTYWIVITNNEDASFPIGYSILRTAKPDVDAALSPMSSMIAGRSAPGFPLILRGR